MSPTVLARALALALTTAASFAAADRSTSRHPATDDTYTITSTLELVNPVDPAVMADDFQDVRVLKQSAESTTVEITYYPLHNPPVGENRTWKKDYAGMTEYLRSNPAENWDEQMQRDLLAELRAAGIEPDRLSDRQLVEQVSRWAMQRSRTTRTFAIWAVHYPDGKPEVHPALRAAFDKQKPDPSWTDQRMFDEEALGRSMFYNKVRGSCTSSSIYLTTIFRALGIPTRTCSASRLSTPTTRNRPSSFTPQSIIIACERPSARRSAARAASPTISSTRSTWATAGCASTTARLASRSSTRTTSAC